MHLSNLQEPKQLFIGNEPLIAFVGAGASVLPPSNLPRWTEFNDLVLESLCESLAEFSQNLQAAEEMLNLFRQRRDETRFMAPDFQAQLLEEEIDADYFNVWESLKTDAYGPVHAGLAELASRGMLAAIVTTNFDQLLETALDARAQGFRVFHDRTAFDELVAIAEGTHFDALPVIKIHGSIEDTSSLVDTLRQRLVGRPEPLMKTLQFLLLRHPWLYLGFSGADFSYDAHYLGILDAAADAKGFVFLVPKGRKIQDGVGVLAHAYGPDKAVIVHRDLPGWLYEAFCLAPANPLPVAANSGNDNQLVVRNRIREWAKKLGPIAVVNILCSMVKSSGMEGDAFWLLYPITKLEKARSESSSSWRFC